MDTMHVDKSINSLMLLDDDEYETFEVSLLMTTRNHQGN